MVLKTSNNLFRDLISYLKIFKKYLGNKMFIVAGLSLVAALSEGFGFLMVMPLFEIFGSSSPEALTGIGKQIYDFLIFFGWNGSELPLVLLITFTFLLKGILVFIAMSYSAYLVAELLKSLKSKLFDEYSEMTYNYYASRDTGHFSNIMNNQINTMLIAFRSLMRTASEFVMMNVYVILAILVSWQFGLIVILFGGILLILFRSLNIYVRELSRNTAYESGVLSKILIQYLHAYKYLTSTSQSEILRDHFLGSVDRYVGFEKRRRIAEALTFSLREPILVLAVMLIIIVQILILQNSIGPIIVALALFYRGLNAIHGIQLYWQLVLDQIGAVEIVSKEFDLQLENKEVNGSQKVKDFSDGIKFDNVSFAYNKEHKNVLTNISLNIPSKQTIAIIGSSGAGKSTLIDLITLLLKPSSGKIIIDDEVSTNIESSSWRSQIGYVSQDMVVFDDSILNNITMWDKSKDKNQILSNAKIAAQKASIFDFIEDLPEKYDTLVGDRGIKLSGGQRQRLFIARELYRNPNILILDEATSALDSKSESNIQSSIENFQGELSIIIIAHRLSTIKNADQVFILEKGHIIESGTYFELKQEEGSTLNKLIDLQKS